MIKVLVTGSNGMLGQDLVPILEQYGYNIIKTTSKTMDITNSDVVTSFITKESPDIVIHCAAYTNVDGAESDLQCAENVNVIGTENVAKICGKKDIPLVYISTDYVFDGTKKEPYIPDDLPNPLNNYGMTKYEGEEVIRSLCKRYYIARTSWLYGIHGKNFVKTMLSLAAKPEIKVVNDQTGCPTWTCELANGILKLIKDNKHYGTYHICGSGHTTWYGFAKEIFRQSGLKVNLKPCTTDEFPRPAKRPEYSVMDNGDICRDWKDALADYLKLENSSGL